LTRHTGVWGGGDVTAAKITKHCGADVTPPDTIIECLHRLNHLWLAGYKYEHEKIGKQVRACVPRGASNMEKASHVPSMRRGDIQKWLNVRHSTHSTHGKRQSQPQRISHLLRARERAKPHWKSWPFEHVISSSPLSFLSRAEVPCLTRTVDCTHRIDTLDVRVPARATRASSRPSYWRTSTSHWATWCRSLAC